MKRADGREGNELRPRKVQLGELSRYEGSARYSMGHTTVVCSVEGPCAAKGNQEQFDAGVVVVQVQHARGTEPAGGGAAKYLVETKRKEGLQEESSWISTISRFASWSIMLEKYPRCSVELRVTILNDEGSLLACILNAVQCAILDSGLQCRGTAAAVTAGFAYGPGGSNAAAGGLPELVLDLAKSEEESGKLAAASRGGGFQLVAGGTYVFSTEGELVLSELRQCTTTTTTTVSDQNSWTFDALAFFQLKSLASSASNVLFDLLRSCGESCHGMDLILAGGDGGAGKALEAASGMEDDAMPEGQEILL